VQAQLNGGIRGEMTGVMALPPGEGGRTLTARYLGVGVGVGIVRSCIALRLADHGADVAVVEVGHPGSGAMANSFTWAPATRQATVLATPAYGIQVALPVAMSRLLEAVELRGQEVEKLRRSHAVNVPGQIKLLDYFD
jgi:hypothetical protein